MPRIHPPGGVWYVGIQAASVVDIPKVKDTIRDATQRLVGHKAHPRGARGQRPIGPVLGIVCAYLLGVSGENRTRLGRSGHCRPGALLFGESHGVVTRCVEGG